ncbi:mucin-5B-like [Clupea harengus]|uniref:Mucin-5B-like n=1 Tax=Clupea harengus TaxID=7950 RepID=A0A8M1KH10_CLUHA|nr:mucin-5B-like [Clupea harengus]
MPNPNSDSSTPYSQPINHLLLQTGATCPSNMEHQECGNPCADTCSNQDRSKLCEEHCTDGCFCPNGTVFDDITQKGCVQLNDCPCYYKGKVYKVGESYSRPCQNCTCEQGRWSCTQLDCPGTCSLAGGSHISTFDGETYTFHGECSYVLAAVRDTHNCYTYIL